MKNLFKIGLLCAVFALVLFSPAAEGADNSCYSQWQIHLSHHPSPACVTNSGGAEICTYIGQCVVGWVGGGASQLAFEETFRRDETNGLWIDDPASFEKACDNSGRNQWCWDTKHVFEDEQTLLDVIYCCTLTHDVHCHIPGNDCVDWCVGNQ